MKVCILADSHDNIPLLCAAVADAQQRGAEAILHCGDIVAPSTLEKLKPYGLPIHAIHGNNTGDLYTLSQLAQRSKTILHYYGQDADITLEGRRIFIVHYPHYARGMAMTGDYDLVCCGHTHELLIETLTNTAGKPTVLCNPGTVGGIGGVLATYVFGDLNIMTFETVDDF
ncbi:MAG: YfcE family phosphodiesterase [Pseudomonadota bacterium]|nr:YfcE family phosphodiesterase [Pseudomonadota bacterium]